MNSGIPAKAWVRMKIVAGQPRNTPGLPGIVQILFHQFSFLPPDAEAEEIDLSCLLTTFLVP